MTDVLTIEAHGRSYRIEDPGGLIGRPLREGVPYEARVLEHMYRRGFEGLAVDAGAHAGNHTLWLAAVCGLEVAAFEPLHYDMLARNAQLNPELAIATFDCGLAETARTAGDAGKGRVRGAGDIELVPLDRFAFDDVALIKVDVEGMEPDVLAGAADTIARCRPVIYAEAWDEVAHDRAAGVLEPMGYRHVKTFGATPLEEWEPC